MSSLCKYRFGPTLQAIADKVASKELNVYPLVFLEPPLLAPFTGCPAEYVPIRREEAGKEPPLLSVNQNTLDGFLVLHTAYLILRFIERTGVNVSIRFPALRAETLTEPGDFVFVWNR